MNRISRLGLGASLSLLVASNSPPAVASASPTSPNGGGPSQGCWVFTPQGDDLGWHAVPQTVGMSVTKTAGEDFLDCAYLSIPPSTPFQPIFNPILWSSGNLQVDETTQRYLVLEVNLSADTDGPQDLMQGDTVLSGIFPERFRCSFQWKDEDTTKPWGKREFELRPNLGWQTIAFDLDTVYDDTTRPAFLHPMTIVQESWAQSQCEQIRLRFGTHLAGGHPQAPGMNDHDFVVPDGSTTYHCKIRRILLTDDYRPHMRERKAFAEFVGKHRFTSNPHAGINPKTTHWARYASFDDTNDPVDPNAMPQVPRRKFLLWPGEHYIAGDLKNLATSLTPIIGPFDDTEVLASEYQVLLARIAGIDGLFHEWLGNNGWVDQALTTMQAAQGTTKMASVSYEDDGDGVNIGDMVDDLEPLQGTVPQIDGQDYFNLGNSWVTGGLAVGNVSSLQTAYMGATGTDAHFSLTRPTDTFADEVDSFADWVKTGIEFNFNPAAPVFNTYYPLTQYTGTRDEIELHVKFDYEDNQFRILESEENPDLAFHGPVFTGFDDSKGHNWLPYVEKRFLPREDADGTILDGTFDALVDRERLVAWIMSFNGFKEGHVLEPTRERGYDDIDRLAERLARWKTSPLADMDPPDANDLVRLKRLLRVPQRLYELRRLIEKVERVYAKTGGNGDPLGAAKLLVETVRDRLLLLGEDAKDIDQIEADLDDAALLVAMEIESHVLSARLAFRWEYDGGVGSCGAANYGLDLLTTGLGSTSLSSDPCEEGIELTSLNRSADFGVDWNYAIPGLAGFTAGYLFENSDYEARVAFEYLDHVTKTVAAQNADYLQIKAHFHDTGASERPLTELHKRVLEDFPPEWAETEIDLRDAVFEDLATAQPPHPGYHLQVFQNGPLYDGLRWLEIDGLASLWSPVPFTPVVPPTTPTASWATQLGGVDSDYVYDVLVDTSGIYVAGEFRDVMSVGSGASALVDAGGGDAFVAKLDHAGAVQWVARGGGKFLDRALQLDLDPASGRLVAQIQTFDRPKFDSGIDPAGSIGPSLVLDAETEGQPDSYVKEHSFLQVEYDPLTGNVLAVKRELQRNPGWPVDTSSSSMASEYGLSPGEGAQALRAKRHQVHGNNALYHAGSLQEHLSLFQNGSQAIHLSAAGRSDVLLAKFPDFVEPGDGGLAEWAVSAGGPWNDWATAVALDGQSVIVVGVFHGSASFDGLSLQAPDFDPDLGSDAQVFIARYDVPGQ